MSTGNVIEIDLSFDTSCYIIYQGPLCGRYLLVLILVMFLVTSNDYLPLYQLHEQTSFHKHDKYSSYTTIHLPKTIATASWEGSGFWISGSTHIISIPLCPSNDVTESEDTNVSFVDTNWRVYLS